MTWFAFQSGYGEVNLTGGLEKEAVLLGFHGYATETEAKNNPNSVNAFQAPLLANIIARAGGALSNPASPDQIGGNAAAAVPGVIGGLTGALGAFEALAQAVTDGALWRSLGWIILGGLLTIIGIALWLKEQNVLPEVVPIPI